MKRNSDKYNRIIDAAVKVFARKGFYNAKVSEIAKEAKVADGTIYLYFQNKDDILISLFEVEMEKILSRMRQELAQSDDPVKKMERFAEVHLELVEGNPEQAEVIQVETRQSSKFMKEYKNEKFMEYLEIISDIVREGQSKGVFREDILPRLVTRAFFGALDEVARYFVLSTKKRFSPQRAAVEISRAFVSGLRVRPGPGTTRKRASEKGHRQDPEAQDRTAPRAHP